jgi:16S rRNA (cytosine1402-N4)-methyltransferase
MPPEPTPPTEPHPDTTGAPLPDETFGHVPVLADEVPGFLPALSAGVIVDCTVGAGGHARILLERTPAEVTLIGLDADPGSLAVAERRLAGFAGRVRLVRTRFGRFAEVLDSLGVKAVDYLLADIGLCSRQLSDDARGFSFDAAGGRLDMRFGPDAVTTAAEIVNTWPEPDLADLIFHTGEDPFARRIARRIVEFRRRRPFTGAAELADVIRGAYPAPVRRKSRTDPATRTFQALRIAVNDELGELDRLLAAGPDRLADGGRMAVISFHSLEDRRVKEAFRARASAGSHRLLTRKPVTASEAETQRNPRARSAKLRVLERPERA